MTDPIVPDGPGSLNAATPSPTTIPTGRQLAGRKGLLIVILVLVLPLAIILWAVKDNVAADDLKVGDCFNVPAGLTVQTIQHFPCTEPHTAEVFHVAEYTGGGATVPISLNRGSFVDTTCTPAFETYVGSPFDAEPDLSIGYFYPSTDGWSSGDRTFTCYVARTDEAPITQSVKGSGTP